MAPGQDNIMMAWYEDGMAWYEDGIPSCFNIDSYPGACQDYTRAKLRCCFPLQEDVGAESQPFGNYHNSAPKKKEN